MGGVLMGEPPLLLLLYITYIPLLYIIYLHNKRIYQLNYGFSVTVIQGQTHFSFFFLAPHNSECQAGG